MVEVLAANRCKDLWSFITVFLTRVLEPLESARHWFSVYLLPSNSTCGRTNKHRSAPRPHADFTRPGSF